MDLDPTRLRARVDRALAERIEPAVHERRVPLDATAWTAPDEPEPFSVARSAPYRPIAPGDAWGRPWGTTWFRFRGRVPDAWNGAVEALVDLGFSARWPGFQAEGLAYDAEGMVLKGIAPRNAHVRLGTDPDVVFYVEAAANPDILRGETFSPTLLGHPRTAGTEPLYVFRSAHLVEPDGAVQELVDDVRFARELLDVLPNDRPRAARVARALAEMLTALDPFDVAGTAAAARDALQEVLSSPAAASAHHIVAVGHAHIDSAWLWPLRETIRKCARTFSNVLDLMDEDPDLVFACSSAQQYAWIAEHHPSLHERIAQRVREGRWSVAGGMWVESDTMMPTGEALVRQFVEGAAYFREAFGVECDDVWLPDSFGYSAAMPQIAVAAGARWFLTQKLSWNDTNRMPHHTFWWRGIDGTGILTHFPPSDTYNAQVTADELDLSERQFSEHAWASRSLLLFGHGDGGGGPTRRMMASARRAADVEGLPRVRVGTPRAYFSETEVEARAAGGHVATWTGEMYLELHRGTLTSQAHTKRGNRRNEQLLHAAELWATTASVRTGAAYPAAELQDAWRTVLLHQFHDILPGSSIGWVHDQAEATHAAVSERLLTVIRTALSTLTGPGERVLVANAAPFAADGIAGGAVGDPERTPPATARAVDGGIVLESASLRATFDSTGVVRSLVARHGGAEREIVPRGDRLGALRLHPDHPGRWDAWDIDRSYRDATEELSDAASLTLVPDERGPVVRVERTVRSSTFVQEWWIDGGTLETRVEIDWRERERLLKLGIPITVHTDRFATETQFGHVLRSVHENTSWDEARYEVCQHRWLHVGEPGFGVAIANDASYGVGVRARDEGGIDIGISLLRGARFPDPDADLGRHEFRFSIAPASGIGDAVRLGYRLGAPAMPVLGGDDVPPLIEVDSDAVALETVKLAADGTGDVIARLYESRGGAGRAVVTTSFPWQEAILVDLHERALEDGSELLRGVRASADPSSRTVVLHDRAFGIATLRFRRA